ncbi:Uncharacterised protein [Legionella sainthelensi]|uniref:hypothetical protein n=2 Tax=Legionella sainthelensi TaxID=28087 RepID=UPI000F6F1494|nr:hypothetical protein [Legionella sainthelensi]VEB35346.1 Uncharacterised protein [Legionella sainthelensi]
MPRHTAIAISNPNYRRVTLTNEDIAQRIRAGDFNHEFAVDFATEQEVDEVLNGWAFHPRSVRVVVSYELMNNGDYRILGFRDSNNNNHHYDFQEPLTFPSVYSLIVGGRIIRPTQQPLAPTAVRARTANAVNLNGAQSTHTASVHASVTESLKKLHGRYSQVNIDENIEAIKAFARRINSQNLPNTSALEREAAIRFIARMNTLFSHIESRSNLTIKHILALIWEGVHDDKKTGALKCDIQTAEESLVKHLYEIQRGYNLDLAGKDLGSEDRPICVGGTINKLTDALNGGIHEDVEIIYITKETAGEKLKALVKEKVVAFVQNSSQKEELITQINNSKTADTSPTWNIPELILNSIQDDVKKSFFDEFESCLMPAQLEEIFTQYEYISLDETNYKQLSKEIAPANNRTDEISNEKTEAKEVPQLPDAITSHKEVLPVPREELAETLNTEQALIQQQNSSQPIQVNQRVQPTRRTPTESSAPINQRGRPAQLNKPAQSDQSIARRLIGFFRDFSDYNPSSMSKCEGDLPRTLM